MAPGTDAVRKICCRANIRLSEAELLDLGVARFLDRLRCGGTGAFLGWSSV